MAVSEFASLPPLERIRRYLQLAHEARQEAEHTDGRVRQSYLLMAGRWEDLAVTTVAAMMSDLPSDMGAFKDPFAQTQNPQDVYRLHRRWTVM